MRSPLYRAVLIACIGLLLAVLPAVVVAQSPTRDAIVAAKARTYGDPLFMESYEVAPSQELPLRGPNDLNPYDVVVFQSGRAGNWDLYKITGSDPNPVPLVASPNPELRPRFRPNSDEVVFTRVQNDGRYNIFRVNITTGAEVQLTSSFVNTQPTWSWNGDWIYFTSSRTGNYELFRMDGNGGNVAQITNNGAPDISPTLSPDGSKVAWIRILDQTQGQLMIANSDGSAEIVATIPYTFIQSPTWSLDGTQIAFDADQNGDGWNDVLLFYVNGGGNGAMMLEPAPARHDLWVSGWDQRTPNVLYFTDVRYADATFQIVEAQLYRNLGTAYTTPFLMGNIDLHPTVASLDNTLPTATVKPLAALGRRVGLVLKWTAQDAGPAPIARYEVQVNRSPTNPTWQSLGTTITPSFVYRDGAVGEDIQFRIRAVDAAHNVGPWSAASPTTKIYSNIVDVKVTDARGYLFPYDSIGISLTPGAIFQQPLDGNRARLYQSGLESTLLQAWVAQMGALENATIYSMFSSRFETYTYEYSNRITNGGFEDGLAGWHVDGSVYQVENAGHTGADSAYVGTDCTGCWTELESFGELASWRDTAFFDSEMDRFGTLHLIYIDGTGKVYYRQRPRGGTWSAGTLINTADYETTGPGIPRIAMALDSTGRVHAVYPKLGNLVHIMRYSNGAWTTPTPILTDYAGNTEGNSLAADMAGGVYFVGHQYDAYAPAGEKYRIVFRKRNADGTWSAPEVLHQGDTELDSRSRLTFLPNGTLHLLYSDVGVVPLTYSPRHKVRLQNGTWVELERPFEGFPGERDRIHPQQLLIDGDGTLHALFGTYNEDNSYPLGEMFYSRWLGTTQGWSTPERLEIAESYASWSQALFLDADKQVYVYLHTHAYNYGDRILGLTEDGTWTQTTAIPYEQVPFMQPIPYYDTIDGLIFLIQINSGTYYDLEFWKWQTATSASTHKLSQSVTIPAEMSLPTLTFFYEFQRTLPDATSTLEVSVNNGITTTIVFSDTATDTGWQQQWTDLTPWVGETVTVTFALNQSEGEPIPLLRVDDVTLSPYLRPILTTISPEYIESGWAGQTVTITGENFVEPLSATANGVPLTVSRVDENTITVTLTDELDIGSVALEIRNGNDRTATIRLGLGYRSYIPLIQR